jgi:23S rRNA (uracil1939-C5)-methyltransferase
VLNHLQRIGKVELPDFEPILGSEKQFSTEIKWNFLFKQPLVN